KLSNGRTLLETAVLSRNHRLVEILLQNGGDPTALGREDQRLLVLAIAQRNSETVRLLLENGADANERLNAPVTDEFYSYFEGKNTRYYLRKDSGLTPIMLSTQMAQLEATEHLLTHNAETNIYTDRLKTYPVNFAARLMNVPLQQVLLGQTANARTRHIVVDLSSQTATIYKNGEKFTSTKVSTGRRGYRTKQGTFVITNKHRSHISTIYGSSMPYFMRLSCDDFGLHQGVVPRYAASHGCIRVPAGTARKFFGIMKVGDIVEIQE
ncbi:MAG: L,D-transpeptidase family protein, partial [Verrucomicrobiota bacterium]